MNLSFRLQKFEAVAPGRGILPDVAVLEKMTAALADEKLAAAQMDVIWERIAAKVGLLSAITWRVSAAKAWRSTRRPS